MDKFLSKQNSSSLRFFVHLAYAYRLTRTYVYEYVYNVNVFEATGTSTFHLHLDSPVDFFEFSHRQRVPVCGTRYGTAWHGMAWHGMAAHPARHNVRAFTRHR